MLNGAALGDSRLNLLPGHLLRRSNGALVKKSGEEIPVIFNGEIERTGEGERFREDYLPPI